MKRERRNRSTFSWLAVRRMEDSRDRKKGRMKNVRRVGKRGRGAGNLVLGKGRENVRYLGDLEGEIGPVSFWL